MHPLTEDSYPRHDWEIVPGFLIEKKIGDETITYYKVRCKKCGLNDPNPPLH